MKTVYALLFRFKWRSLRATGLFVAGLMLLLPARAQTAGTGTINGTVRNEGTGDFLDGAEVRIVGTERVTTTQRDGSFAFTGVPAGRQQLRAFYTGLDVQETTVTVTPNAIATVPLALNSAVYKLEAFTVAGQREGNAAAITRQRTAENIKSVVSMDAYGNVADGNIGNFLQNLTGVAENKEAGDIVGIGLRGTPPELNSVTLDGARTFCIADWDGDGKPDLLLNSAPNVNFFRNLGKNAAGQWAFRDEGPVSTHVLAGHATKPTFFAATRELLIGAEDGFFYRLPIK